MAALPSSSAVRALGLEYRSLQEEPVEGFSVKLVNDDNLFEWEVAIYGPPDTLYQGGYFKGDLSACSSVRAVFLQHNLLQEVDRLSALRQLQELYLQDNCITRLSGLSSLRKLERLVVSGNRLSVVECLPPSLCWLLVARQTPPGGRDPLLLDPHHLGRLAESLTVLDLSDNRLTDISAVTVLTNLQELNCSHNELQDLDGVCRALAALCMLKTLAIYGNPLWRHTRYRQRVLLAGENLEELDGKQVAEASRRWLNQQQLCRDRSAAVNRRAAVVPREAVDPPPPPQHVLFTATPRCVAVAGLQGGVRRRRGTPQLAAAPEL